MSTYTYQWKRCDANGANCVDVGGPTTNTYGLTGADVGDTIRVLATRDDGVTALSGPTPVVGAPGGGFSGSRFVYTLGDPTYLWPGQSSPTDPGWAWLDTAADGPPNYYGFTSTFWERDAAGTSHITPNRIFHNDSFTVMQSVSGSYGNPATSGPCHTVELRIDPSDPQISMGTPGQASLLRIDSTHFTNFGRPTPSPAQGETWWYGFGLIFDAGYQPYGWATYDGVFGNWNYVGLQFHAGALDAGFGGPVETTVCVFKGTTTHAQPNGAVWYVDGGSTVQLDTPRLGMQLIGGLTDHTGDDATHTHRTIVGPPIQRGHLYRIIYRVTWDAFGAGSLDWWVDNVQYGQQTGISTLFRSGGTPDTNVYPQLNHYRHKTALLPSSIIYVGGFVRGTQMADVVIP